MGRVRDGHFVSGIGIAAACASTPAPPPPPLTASVTWNGQSPLPVTGASGVAQTVTTTQYYPNVWSVIVSGGVQPVTGPPMQLINNPSGKLALAPHSSGNYTTIGWSNFAINEVQSAEAMISVTDQTGTTLTRTATVTVQRVS
jgi:hypothetical protein